MSFIVLGTSYRYSPIQLRERLAFSKKRLLEAILLLKEKRLLKGAVILSTCNRTEIYASAENAEVGINEIEDFISCYQGIDHSIIAPYLYRYQGKQAISHLFLVACGLDSLILGETQVLAQVKFSFLQAKQAGFVDESLTGMFDAAVSLTKRVHKETKISQGKISVGSLAVDFIKQKIGALTGKNILIIGVGKITELVLQYLRKENPRVVFISNRTFLKAQQLAAQIGARAIRFDQLKQFLNSADIVISATASPHFIIKKETLQEIVNAREGTIHNKLLIIDLALPRDIQPSVQEIKGVELFCLEALGRQIKENKERKIEEARKVKDIIALEVEQLWKKATSWEPEPVLWP